MNSLAAISWFADNWGWLIAGVIAILGLLVFGLSDTRRFSLGRAWAISGVCFDESIRKRVLWITPLAIIGVIGITQFQRALDEQDAVRQSVKICLFATGLVVMLTSIILACTNLPKEIESRVIYTILTKPTTRLELIIGKVMGFARVSLTIVLIMGVFSWIYLRITAEQKRQQISYRLQEGDISDTERSRLTEYNTTGFLTSRRYWAADELGMYSKMPVPDSPERVISNEGDQDVVASYVLNRGVFFGPPQDNLTDWAQSGVGLTGLVIRAQLRAEPQPGYAETETPAGSPAAGKMGPFFGKNAPPPPAPKLLQPRVTFQLLDENFTDEMGPSPMVGASTPDELIRNIKDFFAKGMKVEPTASAASIRLSDPVTLPDGSSAQFAYAWLPPTQAMALFNHTQLNVRVAGASPSVDYLVGDKPITCFIPKIVQGRMIVTPPDATEIDPVRGPDNAPEALTFRGRMGLHLDQEMSGGSDAPGATADHRFYFAPKADLVNDKIPFQLNLQVDRSNSEIQSASEDATRIDVAVLDTATKKLTRLDQPIYVESRLPTFFSIPADAITGGDFHILLHCENSQQTIGLMPNSLQMVASQQLFEWNLAKSLSIIWMMSILVISLAIFCSTFLSWPIAIVLTVLLLLGHWGVGQVADASGPGLGRQIVNDFKFSDAAIASVVSNGVDKLTHVLDLLSNVLPDTSQFDAIGEIEQGVSVSSQTITGALAVLLGFAVPAVVLAYLILRGKEVAP